MTPFLSAAIAEMLPNAGTGDACDECGFSWETSGADALVQIRAAAGRFVELLATGDPGRTPAPHVWSPSAYVWHVADLVRAWSERLHSLDVDPAAPWAGFDPDELAVARHYDLLPVTSGPWSLARSTDALDRALEPLDMDAAFEHPEWGHGTVTDALGWLAHECAHHELDVRRGLGPA